MADRSAAPWPQKQAAQLAPTSSRQPRSTIPSKRPADAQEDAWVADEDRFVLRQAKKRAAIRVAGGRAQPIDWLAVTLSVLDPTKDPRDEDAEEDIDIVDPEGVFEGLNDEQLRSLEEEIDTYLALETSRSNHEYWETMRIICEDRRRASNTAKLSARGPSSISVDVHKILGPKTYEELVTLEKQIRKKLSTKESIDVDYWQHLLNSLLVFKAKAKLQKVSREVVKARLDGLKQKHHDEAVEVQEKFQKLLNRSGLPGNISAAQLDPESFLRIPLEDKNSEVVDEQEFLDSVAEERRRIIKLGYVPSRPDDSADTVSITAVARGQEAVLPTSRFSAVSNDDFSQAATALYEREVERGLNENEEIFAKEELLPVAAKPHWADKHKPRKPRYFNRVQMGYEWNKYNQTHYDHDNPPPKVVQGYKFNIFYPDLISTAKAPTYRIEREQGRRRGQPMAPAGEEDTCLIKFIAGPPYEEIAFRIVDREWDYSAKRERGFKSSFDKGILQLHFQFKKIYYRK